VRVDAIIPAYNEARTIGAVVSVLKSCPLVDRIHVVDDGSRDDTAAIAGQAGAVVHVHPVNQGKTGALITGAHAATAEVIILFDGDLLGLESSHVESLIHPIKDGLCAMTIGVFQDGRWITDLSQKLTPFLNGQRALVRGLLGGLEGAEHLRYAADTLLSRYAKLIEARVELIPLHGLTHVMREEKIGLVRGFFSRLIMYFQVCKGFFWRFPGAKG